MDCNQRHRHMGMNTITVDGRQLEVRQVAILLDELLDAGIYVPYRCHHPDLPPTGECGLCIVKIDGMDDYQTTCTLRIEEKMVITTKMEEIERLRKEAFAIDQYLGGDGDINEELAPVIEPRTCLGPGEGFAALSRCEDACITAEERSQGFCKVVSEMEGEDAENEAKRCLQCDLRLTITTARFWGEY